MLAKRHSLIQSGVHVPATLVKGSACAAARNEGAKAGWGYSYIHALAVAWSLVDDEGWRVEDVCAAMSRVWLRVVNVLAVGFPRRLLLFRHCFTPTLKRAGMAFYGGE